MTIECSLVVYIFCSGGKGNWSSDGCTTVDDGSGLAWFAAFKDNGLISKTHQPNVSCHGNEKN